MFIYSKLLKTVEEFFTGIFASPELYLQFVLALAVLAAALIFSYYAKKYAAGFRLKNESLDHFLKGFLKLLMPISAALFLTIATVISEQFFKDSQIILHIARLARAWLILTLVWRLSENKSLGRLIVIMLIPILALRILGLFEPTVSYLDAIDFNIGKLRLSLYLMIKGVVAFTMMLWLTGIISETGENYIRKTKALSFNTKELLIKFFEIILYSIVFLTTLNIIGIDLTALAVFGGALGVGIGFGLQKITSNFISGVILLAEKSIKDNDLVEIEGVTGFVRRLGARAIRMESTDGREILIPNEDFITQKVTNWTYTNTKARAEIKIGISYDSDVEKAITLMLTAAKENSGCLAAPAPECFVTEFQPNAAELTLYFWVANVAKGRAKPKSQIMTEILKRFAENSIKIPVTP